MENLKGKNLCFPQGFMRHKKLPTNTVTHPGIMELKSDVVWVGCADKECKNEIAIKKCSKHEFDTQKYMNKSFPKFVPKVFEGVQCFDGFYMYSEYIDKGTLKMHRNDPRLDSIVYKVFIILKTVHQKYPSFRHNDLHIDNILVKSDGTPLLYDFGFANWHGNPIFDSKLKSDYGIYPRNNPMYDFHFFVNSVFADLPDRFKSKARSVFPEEYLKRESSVVKNFRLRSDVKHTTLPTMDQVIKAFSPSNNKMRPKVLVFTGPEKKTSVKRSPPKALAVKFTLANKRRVSNRKAELLRVERNRLSKSGMSNNNVNQAIRNFNVRAELQAIKNIEALKKSGLLTPSPSPKKNVKKAGGGFVPAAAAGPSRPVPVLTFTNSPTKRPRINKKLCTSYKKDELMNVMRRLGHRVNKTMSLKQMCGKLSAPVPIVKVYTRPSGDPILNVRKSTYPKQLKKNLYTLAKAVGLAPKTKNKKNVVVQMIYGKLDKNISNVLKNKNKATVTARQVAETLAKNYRWKNNRHIERLRVLKVYKQK